MVKSPVQQSLASVTEQTEQKRKKLVSHYYNLLIKESEQTWAGVKKQMKEVPGINIEGIISSFDLDVYISF